MTMNLLEYEGIEKSTCPKKSMYYYSKISNSNQGNTVRQKSTSLVTTTVEDKKSIT